MGAEDGATIVVAADGSGDHTSIESALAVAADGDTILVRPGTYEEAIAIEGAVTVRGDGPPESVVLSWGQADPPVVRLVGSAAELSGLTIHAAGSFVHVAGGQPTLQDIRFEAVGSAMETDDCHALIGPDSCNPVAVRIEGGDPTVAGNAFEGPGGIFVAADAAPAILDNLFEGGGHVFLEAPGDGTIVAGNTFSQPAPSGIAVFGAGRPDLLDNVISEAGTSAIDIGLNRQPGIEPVIRGNAIVDSPTGIQLHQDADALVESNVMSGNTTAIVITGSDARLADNQFIDNATGVFVLQGSPVLEDNLIRGGTVGLGLGSDRATPVLVGNAICGNETDINLVFGAEMPDTSADAPCP
jgi:nitrous oxidase accessory protein NosD